MGFTVPPRKKRKLYGKRRELRFWFRGTFTATKKRSVNEEVSWLDKEQVAFISLKNFGLVRGDYRYVDLVDRDYGTICDYERASTAFARQKLSIPERYDFLDLNGVVSIHCLCYFGRDYVRVVNNLLAAITHGRHLDTEALKELLFKDGRLVDNTALEELPFKNSRFARPGDGDSQAAGSRPISQAPSDRGPGRQLKRTSDKMSGTDENDIEVEGLEQPKKRGRGNMRPPADPTNAAPAALATHTAPLTTPGGHLSSGGEEDGFELATGAQTHLLRAISGIFQTRKGRHFGVCSTTPEAVKSEKARRAVKAMGMSRLFPIYDDLTKDHRRLSRYENTTTKFVMSELMIREATGVEKIPSVECGLTIFVLLKMAADLHRLVVGIRHYIMLEESIDKAGIIDLLYEYTIDDWPSGCLIGTHSSSPPLCDEPEWESYMTRWNSRRESKSQSAVELD